MEETKKKDKKVSIRRDEPGINNLVSCWAEEGRASERRLRTTDRILPSCEATGGQEGPPGEVTWPAIHFL